MDNYMAALKEKFKDMDTIEKILITALIILVAILAVNYTLDSIGGGTTGVRTGGGTTGGGGRGGMGLGGLGRLGD